MKKKCDDCGLFFDESETFSVVIEGLEFCSEKCSENQKEFSNSFVGQGIHGLIMLFYLVGYLLFWLIPIFMYLYSVWISEYGELGLGAGFYPYKVIAFIFVTVVFLPFGREDMDKISSLRPKILVDKYLIKTVPYLPLLAFQYYCFLYTTFPLTGRPEEFSFKFADYLLYLSSASLVFLLNFQNKSKLK